jgi:geranylgeranyl pyrophosphate synthase
MFDRLRILYAHVHQALMSWIPPYLVEMADLLDSPHYRNPPAGVLLPLLTCRAVNGDPEDPKALRCATPVLASLIGLEILDDLSLRENPHSVWLKLGMKRATHYAFAFEALANQLWVKLVHEGDVPEALFQNHQQGVMIGLAGRQRLLSPHIPSWEAYWKTAEMADAQPFGHLAASGALLATTDPALVEACQRFGCHLGLTRHLLGIHQRLSDSSRGYPLAAATLTLPILYVLRCEHPTSAELSEIIQHDDVTAQSARVVEILDEVDAKGYLLWAALQERRRALLAIEACPDPDGRSDLEAFLLSWFEPIQEISSEAKGSPAGPDRPEPPAQQFDPRELGAGMPSLAYRSVGLGLRQQVRQTPLDPDGSYE